MLKYVDSIKVSRRIFDMVMDEIAYKEECGHKISGSLNTFNNCREQGYYANIYGDEKNDYKDLYIWVHEQRNSDAKLKQLIKGENELSTNNILNKCTMLYVTKGTSKYPQKLRL